MENKIKTIVLESIGRDIEIIMDNQVEINFPLIRACVVFMLTKTRSSHRRCSTRKSAIKILQN